MKRLLVMVVLGAASLARAKDGETGTLGAGDPLELGVVVGPYSLATDPTAPMPRQSASATLIGGRVHAAAYTHETFYGFGGGVEGNLTLGYAVNAASGQEGFFWGQLEGLANVGLLNRGFGRFLVRLHLLVGAGISVWSDWSLAGGGRLALAITKVLSLEATWLTLPSVNLTLSHRLTGALKIEPLQLALGADLNFGSTAPGSTHFSVVGTATWRPKFD